MNRPNILTRLHQTIAEYPRQFWLLFAGMLISAVGGSMVWPFLTIYVRQRLSVPLTTVGLLLTLNSGTGLAATFIAGPVADRFGRKGVMVISLLVSSLALGAMSIVNTLPSWAIVLAISGAFGPLFRVGSDSMVADMIEPERRAGAYALLRMSNNLGVAIGPAIGGFVAVVSYAWAFFIAAGSDAVFCSLILLFAAETLPKWNRDTMPSAAEAGYGHVLRDRPFLAFCGLYTLAVIPPSMLMVLLAVYAKENFGVPENQYGFIMATNAAMVVLFQYAITQVTKRYPSIPVLAAGALFYALGVGSVALGQGFLAFWLSMVVLTLGEMVLVPTGTTLTANLAPPDMRGRYMSIFGVTWGLGIGIGPVVGGYINDHLSPVAMWYGGLMLGLAATLGLVVMSRWRGAQARAASAGAWQPVGEDS